MRINPSLQSRLWIWEIKRPLARALLEVGLKVWYDEFTLKLGDSLRRSIDHGLSQSRYGVVILSPHFFAKEWPKRELDGLVAREVDSVKVILPIWHDVTRGDVKQFSPVLADRLGVSTASGLDTVVCEIMRVVRPQASKDGEEESDMNQAQMYREKTPKMRKEKDYSEEGIQIIDRMKGLQEIIKEYYSKTKRKLERGYDEDLIKFLDERLEKGEVSRENYLRKKRDIGLVPQTEALEVLEERFRNGEITVQEYMRKKRDLEK